MALHPASKTRRANNPSIFDALTEDQHAKLRRWLLKDKLAYVEVSERCQVELGLLIHPSSISHYWQKYCSPSGGKRPYNGPTQIDRLTDAEKALLKQWLMEENLSYVRAVARIEARFGKKVSSHSIMMFWHRFCTVEAQPDRKEQTPGTNKNGGGKR